MVVLFRQGGSLFPRRQLWPVLTYMLFTVLLLLLHSRLQTPTGRARQQISESPNGEDSPVREKKIKERISKQQQKQITTIKDLVKLN